MRELYCLITFETIRTNTKDYLNYFDQVDYIINIFQRYTFMIFIHINSREYPVGLKMRQSHRDHRSGPVLTGPNRFEPVLIIVNRITFMSVRSQILMDRHNSAKVPNCRKVYHPLQS